MKGMTLIRMTLNGPVDLVKETIERIQENEPRDGYAVKNSFGKDSGVVMALMKMAEVNFDAHHNFTTVDPPQLIRHGLKNYPDTEIHRPDFTIKMKNGREVRIRSMWDLIVYKGFPPLRNCRYCCDYLKERGIRDRLQALGKRQAESPARSRITLLEECRCDKHQHFFNPIFDWSDMDVWEFTIRHKIPYCELYDQGFSRLGCILCPLAMEKHREFEAIFFPKHYVVYLRTFDRMIKFRPDMAEKYGWKNSVDVMDWWLRRSHLMDDSTTQSILTEATGSIAAAAGTGTGTATTGTTTKEG
jgi:phosphoadenosine phosphosulfate reductase